MGQQIHIQVYRCTTSQQCTQMHAWVLAHTCLQNSEHAPVTGTNTHAQTHRQTHLHALIRASLATQMQCRRARFDPWVGNIPWRRARPPTIVFFPGEFHGQRSLVGYCRWNLKELDMTEWLIHFTFMAVPQNITNRTTIWSSNSTFGYLS